MTMPPPRLSIGLPVRNGENFLAASIESVLHQDFTDFELLISDNGSTDRTPDICAHYARRDSRVRVFRHDRNRGGAWNFNHVFALANGSLFKWQAHDDICLPGLFRRCVEVFATAPTSVVLVYPRTEFIDQHGRVLTHFLPECTDTRRPLPHERLADVLRGMTMVRAMFGVIRADALRQTRRFQRMIAADFVLLSELALLGELWEVPETLFQRRIHDGCSTLANRGTDELLQWWDPTQETYGARLSPMLQLGAEYLRAIRHLPLSSAEKLRCSSTALWVWYLRQLRNAAGTWRRRLQRPVRQGT